MKVLVVDDAVLMRSLIIEKVMQIGHEVIGEAKDGIEAIEKYKQLKPDIVTMDINMPQMDGIDALKKIVSFDSMAKIIMISDIGQHEKIIEAIKNGATDFIIKPVHEDRLKSSFQKIKK